MNNNRDIFALVIKWYSTNKKSTKEEYKKGDIKVKRVSIVKALDTLETIKL